MIILLSLFSCLKPINVNNIDKANINDINKQKTLRLQIRDVYNSEYVLIKDELIITGVKQDEYIIFKIIENGTYILKVINHFNKVKILGDVNINSDEENDRIYEVVEIVNSIEMKEINFKGDVAAPNLVDNIEIPIFSAVHLEKMQLAQKDLQKRYELFFEEHFDPDERDQTEIEPILLKNIFRWAMPNESADILDGFFKNKKKHDLYHSISNGVDILVEIAKKRKDNKNK